MELHESLRQLARDHGESLFAEADAFRGALDDYLDEGSASTGTINLLTDAVRLGALQGMVSMLDSGASVEDAVETAGQRLSRDRGSADVAGSQWACAVLGYALGRVPVSLAARLRPDAYTAEPPAAATGPTVQQPSKPEPPAPTGWPSSGGVTSGAPGQAPAQYSPAQQWPSPGAPAASHQPAQSAGQYGGPASPYAYTASPGYGTPSPKKSNAGIIVGAIVAVVVLGVVAVIGIIALSGGDDDPAAGEDTGQTDEGTTTDGSESVSTETSSTVTTDPALTLQGNGYHYTFPSSDWQDLTADTEDTTGTIDSIAAPGDSIAQARGNILVESSSARGETDVYNLRDQWKTVLEQSTGATPVDIDPMEIGGETAVGVELKWTNANGFEVHQIAYLVISGDEQYSITGSFQQGDSEFRETYYDVLETWVWEQ
ncbi:hypothetical protein [Nocardioides antri]|uniref:hypothetical protein n=1 Tax=Nocardioides antri TaxID=2607659 RepID=UPI00165FF240|nr:hypothetical protein [Nocardioides antri]